MNIYFSIIILSLLCIVIQSLLAACIVPIKSALLIDGIGHSVVSGIAVGFLISKSLNSIWLIIGAIASALCMNFMVSIISSHRYISQDSALGISFSTLFALGILLISLYGRNIHLDIDTILLGNIEYALFDTFLIGSLQIPKVGIYLLFCLLLIIIFYFFYFNQLLALFFDPVFAHTKNISIKTIHFLIIILTSVTVVISLTLSGALFLVGIGVSIFGFSYYKAKSFSSFLFHGIMYNCFFGMIGVGIALLFNIPLGASITFTSTISSLLFLLYQTHLKKL
jgi:manganese/zinc/iron transport system permease protein